MADLIKFQRYVYEIYNLPNLKKTLMTFSKKTKTKNPLVKKIAQGGFETP